MIDTGLKFQSRERAVYAERGAGDYLVRGTGVQFRSSGVKLTATKGAVSG